MADKFFSLMEQFSDYFFLNLLWLLCCLPVITIGAATTAMCYICMKKARKEDIFVTRSFFKAFKENFVQSTIVWLCILMSLGLVYFLGRMLPALTGAGYVIVGAGAIIIFLACVSLSVYVFALIARFENGIISTVKNAYILAFSNPASTIWLMGMVLTPFIFLYFFPRVAIVAIIGGGSAIGRMMAGRYIKIFDKVQGE